MENAEKLKIINDLLNSKQKDNVSSPFIDSLTGLPNRDGLNSNIKFLTLNILKKMLTANKKNVYSLLYCDINGLKLANDIHGHSVGDYGIQSIADIIKETINQPNIGILMYDDFNCSIAFRHGGDEFLILLPDFTKRDAEILKKKLKKTITKKSSSIFNLSLAVGAADITEIKIPKYINSDSINVYFNDLIALAEKRMYKDKLKSNLNKTTDHKNKIILNSLLRLSDSLGLDFTDNVEFQIIVGEIKKARKEYLDK